MTPPRHQPEKGAGGFTLAELLVSIGIIILFTAVLLPAFSGFGRRNELRQTAQFVESKILETRGYALAPRAGPATPIERYEFIAPANLPACSSPDGSRLAIVEVAGSGSEVVTCELLPGGIVFTNPARRTAFSVTGQGEVDDANSDDTGNRVNYQIRHPRLTAGENTRTIRVHVPTGLITIETP